MMVIRRWIDNVEYHDYAPTEVRYDPEQDAFTIARADIHTRDRHHHATLAISVSLWEMSTDRISLETAINQGRIVLEQMIEQYRHVVEVLTSDMAFFFDLRGRRIR